MVCHTTIGDLLDGSRERLGMGQMAGEAGLSRPVDHCAIRRFRTDRAIGPIGCSKEDCLLVIPSGRFSVQEKSGNPDLVLNRLFSSKIVCMALSDASCLPRQMTEFADSRAVACFASTHDEFLLASRLEGLCREKIEQRVMIHGTLVRVHGAGTLIIGESGAGKTSFARKLVARGHDWVADDVIVIERKKRFLYGRGHERIRYLMAVRGKGIVDVRDWLGVSALIEETRLDLVVELLKGRDIFRLHKEESSHPIMGKILPLMQIYTSADNRAIDDMESAARIISGKGDVS